MLESQSPGKDLEPMTASPNFRLPDDFYNFDPAPFKIYNDSPLKFKSGFSPQKLSAKRPQITRATTTALADITGSNQRLNPTLTKPSLGSPLKHRSYARSPIKNRMLSPGHLDAENLFNFELFTQSHLGSDDDGLDLLDSGLAKIGEKIGRAHV